MSALERTAMPVPGPKFSRIDGELLFTFVIDGGSIIGPRPATKKDQENHVGAWREFQAAEGLSALDLDGDGSKGGSLPVEAPRSFGFQPTPEAVQERDALRRDLTMLKVDFDQRWGVAKLKAALDKATTPLDKLTVD